MALIRSSDERLLTIKSHIEELTSELDNVNALESTKPSKQILHRVIEAKEITRELLNLVDKVIVFDSDTIKVVLNTKDNFR